MDIIEILNNIQNDPEAVLADETQMSEVIMNIELVVSLLKAKNVNSLLVTVNGEDITLINYEKPEEFQKPRGIQ